MLKKFFYTLTIICLFLVLSTQITNAYISGNELTKIEIDGMALGDVEIIEAGAEAGDSELISIPWMAQYIQGIYKYALIMGSLFAVVILMIGGLLYMTAGYRPENIKKAQKMMTGAISGLVILMASYMILNYINPNLTNLQAIEIRTTERITMPDAEEHASCDKYSDDPFIDINVPQEHRSKLTRTNYGSGYLQIEAADDFNNWMKEFEESNNLVPSLNSSYRSALKQDCLFKTLAAGMANRKCKSNHELGLAVDLGVKALTPEQYKSLLIIGQKYNFVNFVFKNTNDSRLNKYDSYVKLKEIWHFDYTNLTSDAGAGGFGSTAIDTDKSHFNVLCGEYGFIVDMIPELTKINKCNGDADDCARKGIAWAKEMNCKSKKACLKKIEKTKEIYDRGRIDNALKSKNL